MGHLLLKAIRLVLLTGLAATISATQSHAAVRGVEFAGYRVSFDCGGKVFNVPIDAKGDFLVRGIPEGVCSVGVVSADPAMGRNDEQNIATGNRPQGRIKLIIEGDEKNAKALDEAGWAASPATVTITKGKTKELRGHVTLIK